MLKIHDYIETFTNKKTWFDDLENNEYCIEDIAHALSNLCRYTGHCKDFYSVAQHSIYVSSIVSPELKLRALLHDAAEAYMNDVNSPLKRGFPEYQKLEKEMLCAIFKKLKIKIPRKGITINSEAIKEADLIMLATEANQLMPSGGNGWNIGVAALDDFKIVPMSPRHAECAFLEIYKQYKNIEKGGK